MVVGKLYRPPNTTSVAAYILNYFRIPNDPKGRASVRLQWVRVNKQGNVKYDMGITERFKKEISYWNTWRILDEID
jgi:hypothetical protein